MNPLSFPKLEKYINDFSGVLDPEKSHLINDLFAEHERKTGEQVVVVLFPHREGNELLEIGLKVFNENGIGEKNLNNGLLLIIATEEKKIRIVTGKGMELKYSEMACRDIVENHLRPLLNTGKYNELIEVFFKEIDGAPNSYLKENPVGLKLRNEGSKKMTSFFMVSCMISFFCLSINSVTTGLVMVLISIVTSIVLWRSIRVYQNKIYYILYLFPVIFFFVGVLAIIKPEECIQTNNTYLGGTTYECERNIYGYKQVYTYTIGGSDYVGSSSDTSWSSSDSSSSFDGGGGSSNGGGYGD